MPPEPQPSQAHAARAIAEENTRRLLRTSSEAVRWVSNLWLVTLSAAACCWDTQLHACPANRSSHPLCRGAWRFGACAGLFYGVRELHAVSRGVHSVQDTVLAGAVTGAAVGAFCMPHTLAALHVFSMHLA